jgi:FMN phosphatase YigB (HAD superfamily)
VDDTPANVEGALAVGMSAVRYTGFDSLREAIAPVLASPGQNHAS